ncbi:transposase [Streptomyces sp. NPDC001292]|uniref:transposase n=1 Tax=Streptomyces sp. NPDC001292 TaxID=3364558 RepID=UPI0036BD137D
MISLTPVRRTVKPRQSNPSSRWTTWVLGRPIRAGRLRRRGEEVPEKALGPKPVDDRLCLQGILYVLCNDVGWQLLPLELGSGSGQTCWRRLGRWHEAGVFDRLHRLLLAELHARGRRAGLVARLRGCLSHPCEKRGRGHRSIAGRPREDGQ